MCNDLRDQFLAAARFALDQNRKRRIGKLRNLLAQLFHEQALAEQAALGGGAEFGGADLQCREQKRLERFGFARLGDKIDCTQGARMARIGFVALAREHDDFHPRRIGDQLGDQAKAFIRAMRRRGQPQVNQRELRRIIELPQQAFDLLAGIGDTDRKIPAQHEVEGIGDQRIVVDDQQIRLCLLSQLPMLPVTSQRYCARSLTVMPKSSHPRCMREMPVRGRRRRICAAVRRACRQTAAVQHARWPCGHTFRRRRQARVR